MGKKPESPASEVSAKKLSTAKTATAVPPQVSIAPVDITRAESTRAQIRQTPIPAPPSEDAVRVGAYYRWDAAGRPGGDGVRFWLEAEQDLLAQSTSAAGQSLQKR